MRRAAKQSEFKRKYKSECHPWDPAHGSRYSCPGDHAEETLEMATSPEHSKLDEAFKQSTEEYKAHRLMKPRFEDFKLQFEGLHHLDLD